MSLALVSALWPAQAAAEKRICFTSAVYDGTADGHDNYRYEGRVSGVNDQPGYGNWLIARDDSVPTPPVDWIYAYYVQGAEIPEGTASAAIRIWVSHVSLYPLYFVVVRPNDKAAFNWLRARARRFAYMSSDDQARMTRSSQECKVTLDAQGVPDISACRCP